ncbi:MAG: potassium channel family protein [Actinomycetota bacterium]
MHAVIVGCGRVGAELADGLGQRGFTVSVIDKDELAFERLHPSFEGKTLVGPGFDREILEEAGIREAEVFMAVTNGDNSNIVSARIAKEHYQVPKVAARIYDPRRAQIYERLGIQTVATVAWTTDQILARVLPIFESLESTLGSGEVVIVGARAPKGMVGRKLELLNVAGRMYVAAYTRFGETTMPEPRTIVQEDDFLHIAVVRGGIDELRNRLGESKDEE